MGRSRSSGRSQGLGEQASPHPRPPAWQFAGRHRKHDSSALRPPPSAQAGGPSDAAGPAAPINRPVASPWPAATPASRRAHTSSPPTAAVGAAGDHADGHCAHQHVAASRRHRREHPRTRGRAGREGTEGTQVGGGVGASAAGPIAAKEDTSPPSRVREFAGFRKCRAISRNCEISKRGPGELLPRFGL